MEILSFQSNNKQGCKRHAPAAAAAPAMPAAAAAAVRAPLPTTTTAAAAAGGVGTPQSNPLPLLIEFYLNRMAGMLK